MVLKLIASCKANDLDTVKHILSNENTDDDSENINTRDLKECNVLHISCKFGYSEMVDYILTKPIEINAKSVCGGIVKLKYNLKSSSFADTALILATMGGYKDIVKKLIDCGADVNAANDHGNTALHYACYYRHIECALCLASEGSNINIINRYGKKALDRAGNNLKDMISKITVMTNEEGQVAEVRSFLDAQAQNKIKFLTKVGQSFEVPQTSILMQKAVMKTYRSEVKSGVLHGKDVIMKFPIKQDISPKECKILKEEIKSLRVLAHKNLELITAACLSPPYVSLIYDVEKFGNLSTTLHNSELEMGPEIAIKIGVGICQGMKYLHQNFVCHYNLKSSNVLITKDFLPKLTDFGFKDSICSVFPYLTKSKLYSSTDECQSEKKNYYPQQIFDVAWVAPEILLEFTKINSNNYDFCHIDFKKCDVYSFSVIFFEIITREYPYADMNNMRIGYLVTFENVRPNIPDYIPEDLISLTHSCWEHDPKERFSFDNIMSALKQYCLKHDYRVDYEEENLLKPINNTERDTRLTEESPTDQNFKSQQGKIAEINFGENSSEMEINNNFNIFNLKGNIASVNYEYNVEYDNVGEEIFTKLTSRSHLQYKEDLVKDDKDYSSSHLNQNKDLSVSVGTENASNSKGNTDTVSLAELDSLDALLEDLLGNYYTAVELAEIGRNLDSQELSVISEGGTQSKEYKDFTTAASGNLDDSGFFSIQVISKALETWNLSAIPFSRSEESEIRENPTLANAYILNRNEHWFTLRKFGNCWYMLNSLNPTPAVIPETYLYNFSDLQREGYSIFIIRGDLPTSSADREAILSPHLLSDAGHTFGTDVGDFSSSISDLNAAIAASLKDSDNEIKMLLEKSKQEYESNEGNVKEVMNLSLQNEMMHVPTSSKNAPVYYNPNNEDEELNRAIEMSLQNSTNFSPANGKGKGRMDN
ncbi:Ataxin-3 [Lobulomyces angularis]|nr:Ataxin-3 [Lobulomyces angularis]